MSPLRKGTLLSLEELPLATEVSALNIDYYLALNREFGSLKDLKEQMEKDGSKSVHKVKLERVIQSLQNLQFAFHKLMKRLSLTPDLVCQQFSPSGVVQDVIAALPQEQRERIEGAETLSFPDVQAGFLGMHNLSAALLQYVLDRTQGKVNIWLTYESSAGRNFLRIRLKGIPKMQDLNQIQDPNLLRYYPEHLQIIAAGIGGDFSERQMANVDFDCHLDIPIALEGDGH